MSLLSRFPKNDSIWLYSNPRTVQQKARQVFGRNCKIYRSNLKTKKYLLLIQMVKRFISGQCSWKTIHIIKTKLDVKTT